jgi:hypothetical protein
LDAFLRELPESYDAGWEMKVLMNGDYDLEDDGKILFEGRLNILEFM